MTYEEQLIQALKRGEEDAFRQVVDLCQERVLNTCIGFVPNLQDAEDLTQEVFIEVFRSVDHFREEAGLTTWIYRIAVNKSLELLRSRKRKKRWAFFQSLIGLEDEKTLSAARDFNHPGIQLENEERAKVLFSHIDNLPENQRTAFVLHKVEGLSHREIGAVMDVSVSAVEALLHRAKSNLRKSLKTFYEEQMI